MPRLKSVGSAVEPTHTQGEVSLGDIGTKPSTRNTSGADVGLKANTDSYTPAVGDVVEFEYCGKVGHGVVYTPIDSPSKLAFMRNNPDGWCSTWASSLGFTYDSPRVIGHIDIDEHLTDTGAEASTKAYFAEQAEPECESTQEYKYNGSDELKVGDLVEITSFYGKTNLTSVAEVGEVGRISRIDSDKSIGVYFKKTGGWDLWMSDIRPLSGTYAERQAKFVEFHNLKAGAGSSGSRLELIKKMDGNTCSVGYKPYMQKIHPDGIETSWNSKHVPYEHLKPVK